MRQTQIDTYDYLVVRAYKKDRFERFLDFLMANIMILRGLCIIAYIFCKLAEKVTAQAGPRYPQEYKGTLSIPL